MQTPEHTRTPNRQWLSWVPIAVAVMLLCAVDAAVLRHDTPAAAAVGYLFDGLALLGCAVPFLLQARAAERPLRTRWLLMAVAATAAFGGFAIASFETILPAYLPTRIVQTSLFTLSEALYLLAAVLFFSGVHRSVVLVDTLQVLVFMVLRFLLTYSPVTWDHFYVGHLFVGQLVALFLFLIAIIGCAGASSHAEGRFLRVISWFLGLRLLGFFLSDQVSFIWLHHAECSAWDLGGTAPMAFFALYLNYSRRHRSRRMKTVFAEHHPSVAVRNFMPSFLAVVNGTLALFVVRDSHTIGSVCLMLTAAFYVTRTTLFQGQAAVERDALQSRNEHLESLAWRDPLTGCGNRRSLVHAHEKLRVSAADGSFALLLMDIDHFKQANDRFGHMHGDRVLIALARKLEDIAIKVPGSHCARFGGDEFALLLPHTSAHEASELAEELRAAFASHRFRDSDSGATLSVGLATHQAGAHSTLDDLIASADDALYQAKLQGRNCVAAA